MDKCRTTLLLLALILTASTVFLVNLGTKELWRVHEHLTRHVTSMANKFVDKLNRGTKKTEAMPSEYPSAVSAPTKGYSINGCSCVRFGNDIKGLQKARQVALKYPKTQPRWFLSKYPADFNSTCSEYATQRGMGQKVVSYSYYHMEEKLIENSFHHIRYLKNLYTFSRSVATSYPGWLTRVYHNTSADDQVAMKMLCRIHCELSHVDLCHVNNLPVLGNLSKRQPVGKLWRLAVMGDPTVATYIIRDCDSIILPREVSAVEEWLSSGQLFHTMRDHPLHQDPMAAGLWGGHNVNTSLMAAVRDDVFSQIPPTAPHLVYRFDQDLLARKVWPVIKDNTLRHETYHCEEYEGSKSFPTRRVDWLHCGYGPQKKLAQIIVYEIICPEECRKEKDWLWC